MCRALEGPPPPRPPPGPVAVPPSRLGMCGPRERGRGKREEGSGPTSPPPPSRLPAQPGAASGRSGGEAPAGPLGASPDPWKCLLREGWGSRSPQRRGRARHRPEGRREGGRERGRRQPRAWRRDGGSGCAAAAAAREAPGPAPGRETERRREKSREETASLRPEQPQSCRLSPGGQGLRPRGGKLLRDDLSPAVFQRRPQPCSAHGQERIPVRFLLGSGTGTPKLTARPREPSAQSQILRYVQ